MSLKQNRKGDFGFYIIVAIAILLLSGGVIFAGIKYTSSKLSEGVQVTSCRLLNELKFGIKKMSSELLTSGESICNTIDKHTDEKLFVPRSNYNQDKEGAELEIRDMIKKCWYMWLDGAKPDMFRGRPLSENCFTCYTFKIKEQVQGVTYNSLEKSMEDPFYAEDKSDKCAPAGGGYIRQQCNPDEEETTSRKIKTNTDKCCIKGFRNGCENKRGICAQTKPSEEYGIYNSPEWGCPKAEQSCYVKKEAIYSYTSYIRNFGPRGGDIFFKPPSTSQSNDISYAPGEIYAISFVSPSQKVCIQGDDPSAGCYAMIGTYGVVIAGGSIILVKVGTVAGAVGAALKVIGTTAKLISSNALLAIGAYQIGALDNLLNEAVNLAFAHIGTDVPNFIIVSTLKDAKELGCAINYGI